MNSLESGQVSYYYDRLFIGHTATASQRMLAQGQSGRSRVAADQLAHGWSAQRGRHMLSQPEQHAFERPSMPLHAEQPPVLFRAPQSAALLSQPAGRFAEAAGRLEERQREQVHAHQRMTTEQILREQQRRERQAVEERRERVQEAKRNGEAVAKAERREHQDQYELMLKRRWQQAAPPPQSTMQPPLQQQQRRQPPPSMSPAREYELAKQEEAAQYRQQQLVHQRQLEAHSANLSPAERREARIVDWIRGGNPWAEQGFVPLSESQGRREYVSSSAHGQPSRAALSASGIAAGRLQRSDQRIARRACG